MCHLLGDVSERTVRRLAQDGTLDRVRIGHKTTRYTRRSVLALIDPLNESDGAGDTAPSLETSPAGTGRHAPEYPTRGT